MNKLYILSLSLLFVLFLYAMPATSVVQDADATGACCIADGCSDDQTEYSCTSEGGTYQGDRTECTEDTCSGN